MKVDDGKKNGKHGAVDLFQPRVELPQVVGVTEEMEKKSTELLASARAVTVVQSAAQQTLAVPIVRDIRTWVKRVQELGLEFRRPFTDFAKRVKEAEDAHLQPLLEEQKRIERAVADFQAAEQRRVEREEQARREAYEKAERERLEAEEKARKAAERMQTDAGLEKALVAEQKAQEAQATVQQIITAPLPEKAKAAGVAVKKVLRYEVTDIRAVYAARPELCKLEISPRAVQATCVPEMPVPGLRLWWDTVANTRAW